MNSIILRNVHIGSNVIIGAGSVVSKDCADNGAYAGNPAKYIMSIEDFYQKRKDKQLKEAALLAYKYWQKYQVKAKEDIFHEYFMLFTSFDEIEKNKTFSKKISLCENAEESIEYLKHNPPIFKNYDDFWNDCIKKWDINAQQSKR